MSKKRCLRMESLPQDVIERILERLAVKTLVRFKSVSKQWKSIVESRYFKERQMKHRQKLGDPDVLLVSVCTEPPHIEPLRTLVIGSPISVKIPTPWEDDDDKENTIHYFVSCNSCDGLVCLYHPNKSGFVVNPTTRWYRPLPLCGLQQLVIDLGEKHANTIVKLGFGKDIFTGTYKVVSLYNSSDIGLENATTCEVFDFSTCSWRYVTPASPYRIVSDVVDPVFVDGSLHWFTECEETKLVSFNLRTETFQVISKAPFANSNPIGIVMANLDNRLCVSESKWPLQVIWSFNKSNKTWEKLCSLDLPFISLVFDISTRCALRPLALLDGETKEKTIAKKKLLFYGHVKSRSLLTLDTETEVDDDIAFWAKSIGSPVCYFPSLFSI